MARRKQRPELPPGGRRTSSGRITITISTVAGGQKKRLSHSKVLASEPRTYATSADAWAGYDRVMAHLEMCSSNGETLRGFWARWIDPEHHWNEGRSESTVMTYESRTRSFVAFRDYADLPLAVFTEKHLDAFREHGGLLTQVTTISRIFMDAKRRGLIATNPFAQAAAEADRTVIKRTKAKAKKNPPPKTEAVNAMLARLRTGPYPASLLGWFTTGTETGMRGGEIDGMQWDYYDPDTGLYDIQWQWHHKLNARTDVKHGSARALILPTVVQELIQEQARKFRRPGGNGSPYIWTDPEREHWTHNTRDYWWTWKGDGGPTLRSLVGDATMYRATRHHWASKAVNEMGLSPYQASLLFGHCDGGKLISEIYADPDHALAQRMAFEASERMRKLSLDDARRRREARRAAGTEAEAEGSES
jgi:integrase